MHALNKADDSATLDTADVHENIRATIIGQAVAFLGIKEFHYSASQLLSPSIEKTREPHPLNRRLRIYRVVYTDEDHKFAASRPPNARDGGAKAGERNPPILGECTDHTGRIVGQDFQEDVQSQSIEEVEYITRSVKNISLSEERYSTEVAPTKVGADCRGRSTYAELEIMERNIRQKQNGAIFTKQAKQLVDIVMYADFSTEDPAPFKAERMLVEFVGDNWSERVDIRPTRET